MISKDSIDFGLNVILNKFPKLNSYDQRNHHGTSTKRQTCNKFSEVLILSKKLNREEYLEKERERKRLQHSKFKQDPTAYKKYLQKHHHRNRKLLTSHVQFILQRCLTPHEKINRCLTDINRCLTDIFKI